MSVDACAAFVPESRCNAGDSVDAFEAQVQSLQRHVADLQLQLLVKEVVHAQVLAAALKCWSRHGSEAVSGESCTISQRAAQSPESDDTRESPEEILDAQSSWNSATLDQDALPVQSQTEVRCDDEAVMSLLRELQEDLANAKTRPMEPRPSTATSQLPIEPGRLEELVAANLSQWVYHASDVSEPLPEIPGISLSADCICEDLHTGSVKVALVTAELPGRHRTLFVVFKGSSYLLDFINWNLEHDYEVIGDGTHFMHKGAAGVMRNLFFLKVQPTSSFAKQLDTAYSRGVRHLVLTGHSLGGMYAMSGMYFIWREMQTLVPERGRLKGPGRALLHAARCVTFGAPMCFGRNAAGEPSRGKYSKFEAFLKEKAVNFINAGDPCPRAWSAVDPRAVIREAAEAMKEQLKERNMVSRQIATRVIQALSSALLSRPDMDRHIAGCAEGFLHLCSLRLLSREDRSSFHWQRDFRLSRHGFADHAVSEYCDLLFDACYADEPTCHMYDDDDAGTKVPLTRIRPSFVVRLRRSDSESIAQMGRPEPTELAESTATVTSFASTLPDAPSLQTLVDAFEHGRMSELEGKPVGEALLSYKAKACAQGHFSLGSVWLRLGDPIYREIVTKAIYKYQNTWPETLEAKGRLQMSLREAQLLLLALDAYSSHKAAEGSEKARSWHSRRPSSRSVSESTEGSVSFWRKPSMLGFRPWRRNAG